MERSLIEPPVGHLTLKKMRLPCLPWTRGNLLAITDAAGVWARSAQEEGDLLSQHHRRFHHLSQRLIIPQNIVRGMSHLEQVVGPLWNENEASVDKQGSLKLQECHER